MKPDGATGAPPQANVASAVYGQLLATALVVALAKNSALGSWDIVLALAFTMTVFMLAHVYAEAVDEWDRTAHRPSIVDLRRLLRAELPMIEAAATSVAALSLGALGVISRDASVWLAIGAGVVDLCAWGWRIGRRRGMSTRASLTLAFANGLIAVPIVALKVFVH